MLKLFRKKSNKKQIVEPVKPVERTFKVRRPQIQEEIDAIAAAKARKETELKSFEEQKIQQLKEQRLQPKLHVTNPTNNQPSFIINENTEAIQDFGNEDSDDEPFKTLQQKKSMARKDSDNQSYQESIDTSIYGKKHNHKRHHKHHHKHRHRQDNSTMNINLNNKSKDPELESTTLHSNNIDIQSFMFGEKESLNAPSKPSGTSSLFDDIMQSFTTLHDTGVIDTSSDNNMSITQRNKYVLNESSSLSNNNTFNNSSSKIDDNTSYSSKRVFKLGANANENSNTYNSSSLRNNDEDSDRITTNDIARIL